MKAKSVLLTICAYLLISVPVLAQESSTEEANTIRETVRQKILTASNKPFAYIGTITDLIEQTIQLENDEGVIQQITFKEDNINFIQLNNTSKAIEYEDVGIGDYIVAMGYIEEPEVLTASRVLVTSPITKVDRKIVLGKVAEMDSKDVTVDTKDEGKILVTFPRRWKGPEIEDFEVGSNILVVTLPNDDGELEVRTLEIISADE